MQIPSTANMELRDWADATATVIGQYSDAYALQDEDWQRWGMLFFNSPQLGTLHPPNPYEYTTWQDWGIKLAESLMNARGSQHG